MDYLSNPALIIGVALVALSWSVRGTSIAPYVRRFVMVFCAIMVVISVAQCASRSWCPPPMHIEPANNQFGQVCVG